MLFCRHESGVMLDTIARYDSDAVQRHGGHAVVVGGSMAGLLAGRVLADAFDEVTVLDRDPLPDEAVARRGVPQANHVHAMLEAGRSTLEDLFPGFGSDVLAAGGLVVDGGSDLGFHQKGGFLAETPDRHPFYCASRPLFERVAGAAWRTGRTSPSAASVTGRTTAPTRERPGAFTGMIHWYRALVREEVPDPPSWEVDPETLVVWGTKDPYLLPGMAERSVDFCPNGRLERIPDATHWLQHEVPERVNDRLLSFLAA